MEQGDFLPVFSLKEGKFGGDLWAEEREKGEARARDVAKPH